MRLAIVRQAYTPYGGAERFVERALAALQQEGLELSVICRRWSGARSGNVIACDPPYLGRTWRDASFARCVQREIANGTFDLVQSHERIPGCHIFRAGDGVHATWLDIRARAGGWRTGFGQALSPWHRYTLAAEARLFADSRLRAVICNSDMVRRDIAARFGVPQDKLHVIHNGVNLAEYSPALRGLHRTAVRGRMIADESAPVVLYVGSGYARKGLAVLLRAFAALRNPRAQLWIIGKEKHQTRYEHLARQLGIEARARFLGPQADVKPYYAAADVFALPTLYDPFPNAVLEALACGLPVLTSTSSGAAELIQTGRNGAVCDPLDVPALTSALQELCAAPSTNPCEAARDSVLHLSAEAMAGKLMTLYRRLLAQAAGA